MIVSLLVRWLVLTVAVELTAWLLPGVELRGGALAHLLVALLIGLANALAPLLTDRLPRPRSTVLLGLLTLTVNAVLIWAVSALTPWLGVSGLVAAAAAAVAVSLLATVLGVLADRALAARRRRGTASSR
ncbi:hypothetical protein AS188_11260 [Kocuria flava]|uniref:Phage holin family protein n=1 Tax=Kocuria flava TaxID=446860 RepID=A0A0U3HHC4_9MICC|nr:phage holin family protein [Kocuria flava]ALU40232.1 hypothetical protein AS188_11260 [Kocuria flava]GEO92336.1 hypothetical protein KFL01_16420 [Kocuria flava]